MICVASRKCHLIMGEFFGVICLLQRANNVQQKVGLEKDFFCGNMVVDNSKCARNAIADLFAKKWHLAILHILLTDVAKCDGADDYEGEFSAAQSSNDAYGNV